MATHQSFKQREPLFDGDDLVQALELPVTQDVSSYNSSPRYTLTGVQVRWYIGPWGKLTVEYGERKTVGTSGGLVYTNWVTAAELDPCLVSVQVAADMVQFIVGLLEQEG